MANIFKIVSIVALSLGVIFLIVAAVIFIKKKIWIVMADLSGKTARMSIEQMRSQAGQPAPRKRHSSYVPNSAFLKRGKGTDDLDHDKTEPVGRRGGKRTELLKTAKKANETVPLQQGTVPLPRGTVPLQQGTVPLQRGTVPLQQGTVPLQQGTVPLQQGTVPLQQGTVSLQQGTTVLQAGTTVINQAPRKAAEFKIITDIVMIHTAEKLPIDNKG